jgi:DNA-3-methyladenine glycosylase I
MDSKIRCKWANNSLELKNYHDFEYGFRIEEDFLYFERLVLEMFQAGLSWSTILKKRSAFRIAFDNFDFYKVSNYDEEKVRNLLENKEIVRNRLKINATIYNAKKFKEIVKNYGNFDKYIQTLPITDREKILKIFKSNFKFMGPLIVEEFMMSVGFWSVKHEETCFLFNGK